MPPVNYIIYRALVESTFSHGKKKTTRGDNRALGVLRETLLNCGLWITLSTQERQHKLQQLCSAQIHPPCSRGNKGEVNSLFLFKINRSDSGHRRSCPSGFLGKSKDGFSPCQRGRLLVPRPRGTEPPLAASAVAALPPHSLYQRPQINSKRFEIIIRL